MVAGLGGQVVELGVPVRIDLLVHRNAVIGSPRVTGSINASKSVVSVGSLVDVLHQVAGDGAKGLFPNESVGGGASLPG